MADRSTWQFLAGPILALVPVFVWELVVKPWRLRRNLSRLLLAEFRLNLRDLAGIMAHQEQQPGTIVLNYSFSRNAFTSASFQLGELPADAVDQVLRFYSALNRIDTQIAEMRGFRDRRNHSQDPDEIAYCDHMVQTGYPVLDRLLKGAFGRGLVARDSLFALSKSDWMDSETPPPPPPDTIITDAKSRYSAAIKRQEAEVNTAEPPVSGRGDG